MQIDVDIDRRFVRRDLDLHGVDMEIRIPPVHVKRAQVLQAAPQFLLLILVLPTQPGKPARGRYLELPAQPRITKVVVASKVDTEHFRLGPFMNLELDGHLVILQVL